MNLNNYANLNSAERKEIAYKMRIEMSDALTEEEFAKLGRGSKYSQFKESIRQPKTWADERMINWASTYLDANIIFINVSNNKNQLFCGVAHSSLIDAVKKCATKDSVVPTILIGWIDHSHFECIVRIDKITDTTVETTSLFVPSNEKDLETTIIPLMLAYAKKCKV